MTEAEEQSLHVLQQLCFRLQEQTVCIDQHSSVLLPENQTEGQIPDLHSGNTEKAFPYCN